MQDREDQVEYYRHKAEGAERSAKAAKEPEIRKAYEDIARGWLLLAKQHERKS